jgi:hypothetical protein
MSDAIRESEAAVMLLAALEEISGLQANVADHLEAANLTRLRVSPHAMVSRMKAIAMRNGPQWRPSSLRYFAAPLKVLVRDEARAVLTVVGRYEVSDGATPDAG